MTPSYTLNIFSDDFINWMNVLRSSNAATQYRILENFWESQIKSKAWLISELKNIVGAELNENVYIFGGWFGMLGTLLLHNLNCKNVYSVDIDAECLNIGKHLNPKNIFLTESMNTFLYDNNPSIVINTSTEHVSQEIYDAWYNNIPSESLIVLQGNSFFESSEHIRCCENLEHFKQLNPLEQYLYTGELTCPGPNGNYTRFMTIGYKK